MPKKLPPPQSGGSYLRREDGTLHRLTPEEEEKLRGRDRKTFAQAVEELHKDEPQLRASAVIERLKEALGADTDAELAWILGTSPQSLSNRRARNSIPYREAVFISLWARVSLDYLLTGRGAIREEVTQ